MASQRVEKFRNGLEVLRGGVSLRQQLRTELDRKMRERFVRMRSANGRRVAGKFDDVARKKVKPWGKMADYIEHIRAARMDYGEAKGIMREFDAWVDDLYGVTHETGEHKPAA